MFQHIKSSPFHPQSKGQVVRFVDTFKRALLRLKGWGTIRKNIEIFLSTYIATPNPNSPNDNSTAEALVNMKMRQPFAQLQIVPTKETEWWKNSSTAITEQCYIYLYQDNLYSSRIFITTKKTEHQATSCIALENIIYDVDVQSAIWVRYANQLRLSCLPVTKSNDTVIPLSVLLGTFELPQSSQVKPNKKQKDSRKSHNEEDKS